MPDNFSNPGAGAAQNFQQSSDMLSDTHVEEDKIQVHTDSELQDAAFDLDSVLDDIEQTLEENAQDYVNSFVQKGGE